MIDRTYTATVSPTSHCLSLAKRQKSSLYIKPLSAISKRKALRASLVVHDLGKHKAKRKFISESGLSSPTLQQNIYINIF